MNKMTVRKAIHEDAEQIADIFSDKDIVKQTLQLPYPTRDLWRERIKNNGDLVHSLVVEQQGTIKGVGSVHLSPRRRLAHKGGIGICVRSGCRGQGVGNLLMQDLLELCDNWLGMLRMELMVYTDNAAAINLYKKNGFQTEGTLRHYALRQGLYEDVYMMSRIKETPLA